MQEIFGHCFACVGEGEPILFESIDLNNVSSKRCFIDNINKVYGIRPSNVHTANTAGIKDELDLFSFVINGKEVIIGSVEFRMCEYLFYRFDEEDEEIIKKHVISREEYYKKHPIGHLRRLKCFQK